MHIRSLVLILIFISVAPCTRPLGIGIHFQTRFNISSAEDAEDGIAKFTFLVRAGD